jgi:ATPase family AAA domain-containing protein 3A/B
MIVLATNLPNLLDEAIQDRMDEIFTFNSPSKEERIKIIKYHLDTYINRIQEPLDKFNFILKHPSYLFYQKKTIDLSDLTEEYYNEIGIKTEGFSGRELSKLVVSWHDEVYAKDSLKLSKEIIENVLKRHIEKIETISKWNKDQNDYFKAIHNRNGYVNENRKI